MWKALVKQVFLSGQGGIEVFDVPIPGWLPGSILVRNAFSLISSSTEGSAVTRRSGLLGLYEKARSSPRRVEQVWSMVQEQGLVRTWELVQNKLEDYTMIGYSSAGQIVEVDNTDLPFTVGDRVACMGAGFATHAEYVVVPKNLAVRLPDGVALEEAAFAALACIAMQGIRRLDLTPGERIGVIGMGLIGQICIRLLDALGYQSFGIDLHTARVEKAKEVVGVEAWTIGATDSLHHVQNLTEGHGLDGVIVCAASTSDEPVNLAFDLCRQKGRVSVIGDVGLGLCREKMYRKELELRLSCSYGPGRYDDEYELGGRDYDLSHERWTERRHLEHFLRLLAFKKLSLASLVSIKFPVEEARTAYARIKESDARTYGVLFDYGPLPEQPVPVSHGQKSVYLRATSNGLKTGQIQIGIIGTGGYAKGVHIPNLQKLSNQFIIQGLASRSGGTAASVAKRFGVPMVTSDYRELLNNKDIDAVLVMTRHASHARIVLDALENGKHVFVEKPMVTCVADGQAIVAKAASTGLVVRCGFNRRFSPYISAMRQVVGDVGVRMITMRINVGALTNDWSNTLEEGGRLLGEGVHFFDLCNWFIGAEPVSLYAVGAGTVEVTNPNAMVLLRYPDGSTAQIVYTTLGYKAMGKEYFEAFGNSRAVRSDDFASLRAYGVSVSVSRRHRGDKGQLKALEEFACAIRSIPYTVIGADARAGLLATWMALAAHKSASQGIPITLDF
jgi:predicted dehydrogenase